MEVEVEGEEEVADDYDTQEELELVELREAEMKEAGQEDNAESEKGIVSGSNTDEWKSHSSKSYTVSSGGMSVDLQVDAAGNAYVDGADEDDDLSRMLTPQEEKVDIY